MSDENEMIGLLEKTAKRTGEEIKVEPIVDKTEETVIEKIEPIIETPKAPKATEGKQRVVINPKKEEKAEEKAEEKKEVVHSLDESTIFKTIQEKAGLSLSSWDDFKKLQEPVFANDTLRLANEYVKGTNRSIEDFFRLQSLSPETLSEQDKVKLLMKIENPTYTDKDIEFLYNRKYRKTEITDRMDDEEKRQAFEDNAYVDLLVRTESNKAEQEIRKLKSVYEIPLEKKSEAEVFNTEGFKFAWKKAADDMESISFDVSQDKSLEWQIDQSEKEFFKNPVTPTEFVNGYKNADGTYDASRFAADIYVLRNLDKIIRAAAASRMGEGVEELIDEAKGLRAEQLRKESTGQKVQAKDSAKAIFG